MSKANKTFHKLRNICTRGEHDKNQRLISIEEMAARGESDNVRRVSYVVNSRTRTIFFTLYHGFGFGHMPADFVPISTEMPNKHWTIEDVAGEAYQDYTVIDNYQELAAVMDKFYPEFSKKSRVGFNWQPEHFPPGSEVQLQGVYVDPETKEIYYAQIRPELQPLVVTVQKVVSTGLDDTCVVTTMHDELIGFKTFNFTFVDRVLKRTDNKVVWQGTAPDDNKRQQTFSTKTKCTFYANDRLAVNMHLFFDRFIDPNFQALDHGFMQEILKQTFKKTLLKSWGLPLMIFNKKRLKRYIKANVNRWLMSGKEKRKAQLDYDQQMERDYFDRMERDLDDMLDELAGPADLDVETEVDPLRTIV